MKGRGIVGALAAIASTAGTVAAIMADWPWQAVLALVAILVLLSLVIMGYLLIRQRRTHRLIRQQNEAGQQGVITDSPYGTIYEPRPAQNDPHQPGSVKGEQSAPKRSILPRWVVRPFQRNHGDS